MSRRKVFLVGDGRVGSTFANDLLQNVRIDELVICDVVKKITEGDALDLEDLAHLLVNALLRVEIIVMQKMPILL